jgi:hypothetical protein
MCRWLEPGLVLVVLVWWEELEVLRRVANRVAG